MQQLIIDLSPSELPILKIKMLNWLRSFSIFTYLDNNGYGHGPNRYELLAGAGAGATCVYDELPAYQQGWLFGHVCYDYKNTVEPTLYSKHPDPIGFKDACWFRPEIVVCVPYNSCQLHIEAEDAELVWRAISAQAAFCNRSPKKEGIKWQQHIHHDAYLDTIQKIRQHIIEGDCYELNYCVEAFVEDIVIDPIAVFQQLNAVNPSPFAALYRNEHAWLLCASPERFLYKDADVITAQPIKGTIKRSKDANADQQLRATLLASEKDQAENIMIVDLMRNDLAKSCITGSVSATEIFGLYTFPQVHHLISTVQGSLKPGITTDGILLNAFPMGSMTGAPKVKVMELIEKYEHSRRGIYSGTVGYINPDGDFDFNVVIRSLMYNETSRYLSYQTGGAITYDSQPQQEWEEVLLKARAMKMVVKG
jgi:para-aminobenzoate synthetase component 1